MRQEYFYLFNKDLSRNKAFRHGLYHPEKVNGTHPLQTWTAHRHGHFTFGY